MKRQRYGYVTHEVDDYSLAQLGRAIAYAPRRGGVHVWRTFVRTRGDVIACEARTQRIRIRPQAIAR